MKKTKIARAITILTGLLCVEGVFASGFQLQEQNASGLGNAFAGSAAVADNASTIFSNPAGMTQLQGKEFSVGLDLVKPRYQFNNTTSANTPAPLGSNGGDAGGLAFVPNAYMSLGLTKDLYLGLGVSSPFGLKTEYDVDWIGRFQSTKFDIKTYNVNPSLAYRINDKVSVGLGLDWQRMEVEYKRQAAVVNAVTQATGVTFAATDESLGWNAGALFNVSSSTRVGLSYRSRVKHELLGSLTSTNQAVSPDVGAQADITLPATYILSVSQKLDDRWEMLGDISRTGWASIQDVSIVRTSGAASGTTAQTLNASFRNTWRLALGANYKANDDWKLKYGVAYDQSPVRSADQRLVALPDNDRVWFSLGAQWTPSKTSTIDVGASYIYVRETQIDSNQSTAGRGRVTGTYDGSIFILGAQYSMAF